ncbi:sensor histidine kinase [Acaryochloris marina NIES-2412]|uniref:sensor histidine kinase n=1 Tax=Acaryochloris marina TaxID=155978 RepID=UPI004058AA79
MFRQNSRLKHWLELLPTEVLRGRLSRKIAFWIFSGLVVIEIIILLPSYTRREQELLSNLEQSGMATLKPWVNLPWDSLSTETVSNIQNSLVFDHRLYGAVVISSTGQVIATFGKSPNLKVSDLDDSPITRSLHTNDLIYDVAWSPSAFDIEQYTVIASFDASEVKAEKNEYLWRIIGLIVLICLTVTLVTMLSLRPLVLRPIAQLRLDLQRVGLAINQDQPQPPLTTHTIRRQDELGEVVATFHLMVSQIYQAIQERKQVEYQLQELNENLSNTLTDLKAAQTSLVEAEKMAALGNLVAGVAHEINTPIGTSITVASTLNDETTVFLEAAQSGQLKRSVLNRYIEVAQTSAKLINSNLDRAGQLIQSFKQVAVDQSHESVRTFNLKDYLEDIGTSLQPQIKRSGHHLEIQGEDDIVLTLDPGIFAQIITNLVTNSIKHAYPHDNCGTLKLEITTAQDQVILEYCDDGCGVPSQCLSKIFDPFFTTARHLGGTGLGLHIVYNIVVQSLNGTIKVNSQENNGSQFIITFPLSSSVSLQHSEPEHSNT